MLAIHGVRTDQLPAALGEGTFRVELVAVEGSELMLQRRITELAHQRGASTVLVGEAKRRKVPPVDRYVPRVPEETYCYVVFSNTPVAQ